MNFLIFYTGCAFGLAYIVGHAAISLPVREWLASRDSHLIKWIVELIECPACFGFWTGLITGLWMSGLEYGFYLGLWTCSVNFVLARWTGLIEKP